MKQNENMETKTETVTLQHVFTQRTPKSPLKSRWFVRVGDEVVMESGSSVLVLRWLNRNGFFIPVEMQGPQCWDKQYTVELEK
jgi:hypothetical protein